MKNFSPPAESGKSCDGPAGWPYYNLQMPGGGVILAGGWPGQWASSFSRDAARGLRVTAGQQLRICGFPDWVNHQSSDLDPSLPGIHMQGCCSDATIRGAHAVGSETVTGTERETRVNLAFNRPAPLVRVVSCLPHRGELDVFVKRARCVPVRVPAWALKSEVKVFVGKRPKPVRWEGSYVVFDKTRSGQQLTVTYPLRVAEVRERIQGVEYTERWRGNTIVDISPLGKWIPLFQRPQLELPALP